MSDTKLHPIDIHTKSRIRKKEVEEEDGRYWESWRKEAQEFLARPGIPIIDKIKNLPDFIVDGRLLSLKDGKSYILENEEQFVKSLVVKIYDWEKLCTSYIPYYIKFLKQLKFFRLLYEDIVENLQEKGIRTQKGDKTIREIFNSWENQFLLLMQNKRIDTKSQIYILRESLISVFLYHVPQADNTDVANYILTIMQNITEIPFKLLPKYHSLRQEIGKFKKELGDKEKRKNHAIRVKLIAEKRLLRKELARIDDEIEKHGGLVHILDRILD